MKVAHCASLAITVIAMFNLITGYILSQNIFETLPEGDILAPENVARQKRFPDKLLHAFLTAYE